jgi:hypothetical protein
VELGYQAVPGEIPMSFGIKGWKLLNHDPTADTIAFNGLDPTYICQAGCSTDEALTILLSGGIEGGSQWDELKRCAVTRD